MKTRKKYYIKKRDNPQLGTYYLCMGLLGMRTAKANEKTLYGENKMIPFDTEEEYRAEIQRLNAAGERVES